MSLDDELRSAFEHEALTRPAPPPDPGGLIRGGRVRRRRRTLQRAGAGTAAAVLTVAVGYGLLPLGSSVDPVASRPAGTPSATAFPESSGWVRPELAPGTYRALVGTSAAGGRIQADLTVEGDNWSSGDYPLATGQFGSTHAGIGVYQPHALAAGSGCVEDVTTSDLGRTPGRLANQLARLPRSTVVEPPTPERAFGHATIHLRLRIDVECPTFYRVADSRVGERGKPCSRVGASADRCPVGRASFRQNHARRGTFRAGRESSPHTAK